MSTELGNLALCTFSEMNKELQVNLLTQGTKCKLVNQSDDVILFKRFISQYFMLKFPFMQALYILIFIQIFLPRYFNQEYVLKQSKQLNDD